jgi:hypothetical protein
MSRIDDMNFLPDDDFARLVERSLALPDAPRYVVDAAVGLWRDRRRASLGDIARSLLHQVKAELTFDSWATSPSALGLRSQRSDTRHLLFSAKGRDIDIRISPSGTRYAIAGQILGPDEQGLIQLVREGDETERDGATAHSVALDAQSAFRVDGVDGGRYALRLRIKDDEILVSPLVVGRDSG